MFKKLKFVAFLIGIASIVPVSIKDTPTIYLGQYAHFLFTENVKEIENIEEIIEEASPAVVLVNVYKEVPVFVLQLRNMEEISMDGPIYTRRQVGTTTVRVSSGSGFFFNSEGYLFTNNHVVDDPEAGYTIHNGQIEMSAEIVYGDSSSDIAILKVNIENTPFINLSDSSTKVGDSILTIGNPFGEFIDSVSVGKVLNMNESIVAQNSKNPDPLENLIMTSSQLFPGDSGGPLINSVGKVVGMNVAIVAQESISFSIPVGELKKVKQNANIEI